jgi:hypothetical protein
MTLPLNFERERSKLIAKQLFEDVVRKMTAMYPNASPDLVRDAALVHAQKQLSR